MTSMKENQFAAAREFHTVILEKLTNEKGVHAETAIAGAARMAGTFLLRSFKLPMENLEPGAPVFSDAANEKGPLLVNLLGGTLQQMNVRVDPERLAAFQNRGDEPQLGVLETQALLETDLSRVREKYQLTYEEAAYAAAFATALMVRDCSQVVEPHVGFNVAAYSLVEGAKTVPQRLRPPAAENGKKPWYKLW